MTIHWIDHKNKFLPEVKKLGKENSKTLGFFPEGAFDDAAKNKRIAIAFDNNHLLGYILVRISQTKRIVYIVHLCINPEFRNSGVAKNLLNEVKNRFRFLTNGIGLSCREDYTEASNLWRKYGFVPKKRKKGRSKVGLDLIQWYYDFGNPDLFKSATLEEEKYTAVLDANIFIKLRDEVSDEEVQSLEADWLTEDVDYYYAQEIFIEIERDLDKLRAKKTIQFLGNYLELRCKKEESDEIFQKLEALIPGSSTNDSCDKKQLAEAICENVDFFISLDSGILNYSEKIEEVFPIKIMRPSDFILHLDYHKTQRKYQSQRITGAIYEYVPARAGEIETFAHSFTNHAKTEKVKQTINLLNQVIVNIDKSSIILIKDPHKTIVGAYAIKQDNHLIEIPYIRTSNKKHTTLLFQPIINSIFQRASKNAISKITISDRFISKQNEEVLTSFGFVFNDDTWVKYHLKGEKSIQDLRLLSEIDTPELKATINALAIEKNDEKKDLLLTLEKTLFPVKLIELKLPVYVIPIRPYWAANLFDYHIAKHSLWGANIEKAWRKENIYYRNVRPVSEKATARILWYVSAEKRFQTGRSSGIVATSYLNDVYIDSAKNLFKKFKDFGMYEWRDILDLAKNNPEGEIKALLFSDTEVFDKIIPLSEINTIFQQFGRSSNTFASPVEVSPEIFSALYLKGINS